MVGLVAVAVYALHGYQGLLDRDLGVFTYGGEQVARGVPPYVGIFNSVGPLADAVPGAAIRVGQLVGVGPVLAERLLFTLLSAACCALLSVLARQVLRSRAAGFVAPAIFLTFQDFLSLASDGPREKTTMVLFLLAALVLVGRRRWFAAGICTALATLAWQPVLLVAVVAAGVTLLASPGGRLRGGVRFVAGGLVTVLAGAAYFLEQGALHTALEGLLLVNADYTQQPSAFSSPAATWRLLWDGYHWSLWVVAFGLVALIALGARSAGRVVRRAPAGPADAVALTALGAAALAGIAWTASAVNGAPDLFELLPFAALGAAGAVEAAGAWVRDGRRALLVAVVVTATVAATVVSVTTRNHLLEQQRSDIAAVLGAAPAGASLLSINAPEVLALADRVNPSGLQLFDRTMERYLEHSRPGGLAGYAAWVARLRPTFIVVGRHYERRWPEPMLARDYWTVGRGTTWTWYLSRTVGPAVRAAVVAANESVMRGSARATLRSLRRPARAQGRRCPAAGGRSPTGARRPGFVAPGGCSSRARHPAPAHARRTRPGRASTACGRSAPPRRGAPAGSAGRRTAPRTRPTGRPRRTEPCRSRRPPAAARPGGGCGRAESRCT